jgi:molybdate transport system ATP-binding protein
VIEARLHLPRDGFVLDVDLALPSRGVSALFGPSGCGKTTVLRALAGLAPAAGRVALDGRVWQDDARRCFVPTHRRELGYVLQEAALFPHLDVRRNLDYGLRRVATQRRRIALEQAIELLDIGGLMARRPDTLSGGERQRVAIARAILHNPRILILDEATASVDTSTEQQIQEAIGRLVKGRTTFAIAHRLNTLRRADRLVVLKNGCIEESGTHAELLAREGAFSRMVQAQREMSAIVEVAE